MTWETWLGCKQWESQKCTEGPNHWVSCIEILCFTGSQWSDFSERVIYSNFRVALFKRKWNLLKNITRNGKPSLRSHKPSFLGLTHFSVWFWWVFLPLCSTAWQSRHLSSLFPINHPENTLLMIVYQQLWCTDSHKSEHTPLLFMGQHLRNNTLTQCKIDSIQLVELCKCAVKIAHTNKCQNHWQQTTILQLPKLGPVSLILCLGSCDLSVWQGLG